MEVTIYQEKRRNKKITKIGNMETNKTFDEFVKEFRSEMIKKHGLFFNPITIKSDNNDEITI